jgi:hypothetical protein
MPLTETYPQTVVFVIALGTKRNQSVHKPIGTGFVVGVPSAIPNDTHMYVVTASHVIASGEPTWLRFNTPEGGFVDYSVSEWFSLDPTADVAVTPVTLTDQMRTSFVSLDAFLDSHTELSTSLGDIVYFIGLLANMRAMAEANIPMVRSGTLGRLYQMDVPMKRPDNTIFRVTGHLIDCRSFGGFSGSPCFVQFEHRQVGIPAIMTGKVQETSTHLLGLISGHWNDPQEAKPAGNAFQTGTFEYEINTGVGIVTPVEFIREALNLEELVEMRRDSDEKRNANEGKEDKDSAATRQATNSGEHVQEP